MFSLRIDIIPSDNTQPSSDIPEILPAPTIRTATCREGEPPPQQARQQARQQAARLAREARGNKPGSKHGQYDCCYLHACNKPGNKLATTVFTRSYTDFKGLSKRLTKLFFSLHVSTVRLFRAGVNATQIKQMIASKGGSIL